MKKFTFIVLLAILPFLGFGQNLVTNPTFAGASDWTETQTNAASGIDAGVTRTADGSDSYIIVNNGSFNSRITNTNIPMASLTAGSYIFSYWVKGDAGVKTRPQTRDDGSNVTGLWTGDGTSDTYTIVTSDTWEFVEFTFSVTAASNLGLRIFNRTNVDGTAISVDDVSFTYVPPTGNTLTVNTVGAGTVAETLNKIAYDPTDIETLTATPATHWEFDSWSGDLSGSTNPETILMDADKTVTANFTVEAGFDYDFQFDTDGDLEGWTLDPQLALASHTGGEVALTPTTDQWARFSLFDFPIPTASYNKVTITLKNESTNDDQLGFILINGTTQVVTQSMTTSDTAFQSYTFDATQFTNWTGGDIESVRVRFTDADNPTAGRSSGTGNIIIESIVFEFDASLSSKDFNKVDFEMYPNPAKTVLNINSNSKISNISIFEITGKRVLEVSEIVNNKLDVSHLNSGIYLLKAQDEYNNISTKKLIID